MLQYQTGQTYKHIKQFEIKQKSLRSGKSAITVRFEPQEIVPNLAPDLFGLLQAHLYMKFENDAGILWKRREVQVEVSIFNRFFTYNIRLNIIENIFPICNQALDGKLDRLSAEGIQGVKFF